MKFIEFPHPEGGRMLVHIDHITSAIFRPGAGEIKTRLGLDLDERQNEIILFGEEAEQTWEALQRLKGTP
ncbi:MAG TPA: hypothetical protein VF088_09305 [Pyrinomonadaceae bacterium]